MNLRDVPHVMAGFTLAAFLVVMSIGCSQMSPARTVADMALEPRAPLTLGAGDVIDVKHFYVPELDESQIVRPDGYMALPLIGEVKVEGKTPTQLQKELVMRYEPHLKKPQLTVLVRRVYDSRVWVTGEVKRPGAVQMPGRLTVLEAITEFEFHISPVSLSSRPQINDGTEVTRPRRWCACSFPMRQPFKFLL